ncbi:hypothetical protein ASPFODRAFT_38481 [Aspergillus luchuensis CBS 106.47]|uniref:Uncharacterized protein n=1 Tax=Aspergillus luchuensis (strain CBS 106.47) TaxID=1137211 RepID=A0A1M3SZP6_ASPLC|nr:hypothetical protein ASPFODRAFT_38481 [Aspergillus luchuensis CBS 106.47]
MCWVLGWLRWTIDAAFHGTRPREVTSKSDCDGPIRGDWQMELGRDKELSSQTSSEDEKRPPTPYSKQPHSGGLLGRQSRAATDEQKERRYFDSGDLALSAADKVTDNGEIKTGAAYPMRDSISRPAFVVPLQGLPHVPLSNFLEGSLQVDSSGDVSRFSPRPPFPVLVRSSLVLSCFGRRAPFPRLDDVLRSTVTNNDPRANSLTDPKVKHNGVIALIKAQCQGQVLDGLFGLKVHQEPVVPYKILSSMSTFVSCLL